MRFHLTAILAVAAFAQCAGAAASCESLMALSLPEAAITSAGSVEAGDFTPPSGGQPIRNLPALCRATLTLTPSKDSEIRVEVWMPTSGWNGKLQAVGNGGWSGTITYTALATAVAGGYAARRTHQGHSPRG